MFEKTKDFFQDLFPPWWTCFTVSGLWPDPSRPLILKSCKRTIRGWSWSLLKSSEVLMLHEVLKLNPTFGDQDPHPPSNEPYHRPCAIFFKKITPSPYWDVSSTKQRTRWRHYPAETSIFKIVSMLWMAPCNCIPPSHQSIPDGVPWLQHHHWQEWDGCWRTCSDIMVNLCPVLFFLLTSIV